MQQQNRHSGLEIRENIFENVPHVIIGKNKPQQPYPSPMPPQPPQQPRAYQPPPYQPRRPDDLVDKLKKYALIVFTILILGTASIFILREIFGRFF